MQFINPIESFLCVIVVVVSFLLGSVLSLKDSFCRDLTDYGDLEYINETVIVCSSNLEKTCENRTVDLCLNVTEIECEVDTDTDLYSLV